MAMRWNSHNTSDFLLVSVSSLSDVGDSTEIILKPPISFLTLKNWILYINYKIPRDCNSTEALYSSKFSQAIEIDGRCATHFNICTFISVLLCCQAANFFSNARAANHINGQRYPSHTINWQVSNGVNWNTEPRGVAHTSSTGEADVRRSGFKASIGYTKTLPQAGMLKAAGEMPQMLRELAAIPEDPGLIPRSYMATYNHL